MKYARANPSTQQTDTVLVQGQPDHRIRVYGIFMSSDTQLVVSLEQGSELLWKQYLAADGGHIQWVDRNWGNPLIELDPGEDLTFTTSAAGNVFVGVSFLRVYSG